MSNDIPQSPQNSPTSPKAGSSDEAVALQLQQWLDDWHYRVLHSSLGRQWSRKKVLSVAFDILELNGLEISPKERATYLQADEWLMVDQLVSKFSGELRENFKSLSLQLQIVITSMTRIRDGIENDNGAEVQEVLEADNEQVVKSVLKHAVVQASGEIAKVHRCQETWSKNMTKRLDRLQNSAALAEHANQQLLAVEAQLATFADSHKKQSKQVLQGMAAGNDKALMHSCFSSWVGDMIKVRAQHALRDKLEKQAQEAERNLLIYVENQVKNVRNVLMRNAKGGDEAVLNLCWSCWVNDLKLQKDEGGTLAAMKAIEDRMAAYKGEQKRNTMAVMEKVAAESDGQLTQMVFNAFVQFHSDYQKDKELEDAVKKAEGKLREHLDKKKEEAKAVLDRMSAGTDAGLLAHMVQYWWQYVCDEKKDREREDQLHAQTRKFKSLANRQKGNAVGVQTRVNEQIKLNLLLRCMGGWLFEVKVNRVEKHFTQKIDGKRRQLSSVQSLFKSFATQLEQGIGQVDDDSSGRASKSKRGGVPSSSKLEQSVSLPNIHARA